MNIIRIEKTYTCDNNTITNTQNTSVEQLNSIAKGEIIDIHNNPAMDLSIVHKLLLNLKSENLHTVREYAIREVKQKIQQSVTWDVPVIQAIRSIEEIDKLSNVLSKRLRDWFNWQYPYASKQNQTHEEFVALILNKSIEEIQAIVQTPNDMGTPYNEPSQCAVQTLATQINELFILRESTAQYVHAQLKQFAPNFFAIAGGQVGAKLLAVAGSMRQLARMPSSTIQVLGAEKALFRHLKTGARPPKYGILFQHSIVQKSKNKGRTARNIANIISIAAKTDYFSKKDISQTLLAKLNET